MSEQKMCTRRRLLSLTFKCKRRYVWRLTFCTSQNDDLHEHVTHFISSAYHVGVSIATYLEGIDAKDKIRTQIRSLRWSPKGTLGVWNAQQNLIAFSHVTKLWFLESLADVPLGATFSFISVMYQVSAIIGVVYHDQEDNMSHDTSIGVHVEQGHGHQIITRWR